MRLCASGLLPLVPFPACLRKLRRHSVESSHAIGVPARISTLNDQLAQPVDVVAHATTCDSAATCSVSTARAYTVSADPNSSGHS